MFKDKSLTDLRTLAQAYGIKDFLAKDKPQLIQELELKIGTQTPIAAAPIPRPEYDARLMTKTPARKSDRALIEELLATHVSCGLRLEFPEPEIWAMSCGKKNDTGTIRMPPRVILGCADAVLK